MTDFWTTITLGKLRFIAYPSSMKYEEALKSYYTIIHEVTHSNQAGDTFCSNVWFYVKYLLLPLPVLGAWFRFKYEAEAYVIAFQRRWYDAGQVMTEKNIEDFITAVAETLWSGYFFPLRKSTMESHLRDLMQSDILVARTRSVGRIRGS